MTTRIPAWKRMPVVSEVDGENAEDLELVEYDSRTGREHESEASAVGLTPLSEVMVDQSVEASARNLGYNRDKTEVMKSMLARDANGPVIQAYFSTRSAAARAAVTGVIRKELTISYVLQEQEVLDLTDYAPEFRLRFHNRDSHDHAMAAATRVIDHKIIASRLPVGLLTSDIGGNPLVHIKAGSSKCHSCGPIVDAKDPMRHRMRKMEAQQLAEAGRGFVATMARKYLDGDESVVCGRRAQECTYATPVATAIHVYDIPMRDWPLIMEQKKISVVEGCLLFSPRFFEEREGVLGVSKARFEIDVAKDVFRMGFSESPSWWYEHSFGQYILYGTDQSIVTDSAVYSYKIIERRGDTIFFRILRTRTSGAGLRAKQVSYKAPGVPVVKVNGFKMDKEGSSYSGPMKKAEYFFPANLWNEMVSQASEDFERGVMDFNKMYNHYRTVSVRHTINAVLVMGGERVSPDELVPLVVHSCLVAAASSLLGQRETRGITTAIQDRRQRLTDGTGRKLLLALGCMVKAALLAPLYPMVKMASYLSDWRAAQLAEDITEWEPQCEVVQMDVRALMVSSSLALEASNAPAILKDAAVAEAPFDHFAALEGNKALKDAVRLVCPNLDLGTDEPDVPGDVNGAGASGSVSEPPSYKTNVNSSEVAIAKQDRASARRAAIREHIEEAKQMNRAVSYACANAYRALVISGSPNEGLVRKSVDVYRNADFWWIESGVVTKSLRGLDGEQFTHSAVYTPVRDEATGEYLRSVSSADWTGTRGNSTVETTNRNFVIDDTSYTGWSMVTDDLNVYNGPEIIGTMEKAIDLPHDYEVTLQWGPPGCGKTYKIIHEAKADGTDAIMCPVRESIEDTRSQLVELHKDFPEPKRYVRTVDSYLVNYDIGKRTKTLHVRRLLADECFMTHAGKLYAAAALLGADEILAFGDHYQIPHIPRVQAPKVHVKLVAQDTREEWITRRCPATAVAAWGSVYNWRVRTNRDEIGEMVEVKETKGRSVPRGCVMMCMFQADKKELKKMYSNDLRHVKIMTAHESEGKTFEHVWLHRFDTRKRSDKMSLFDQQPHVLVAMSRHTKGFVYRCPADLDDLVSQWIKRSKDPRRRSAAADVESAGISKEKL